MKKKKHCTNRLAIFTINLLVFFVITCSSSLGAGVSKTEALALADMWHVREWKAVQARKKAAIQQERMDHTAHRQVFFLVDGGVLLDREPADQPVLAYVVAYESSGFVVMSGDDRLLPIVAFDPVTEFRWDAPDRNFLRYFLEKNIPARWRRMQAKKAVASPVGVHPMWQKLWTMWADARTLEPVPSEDAPLEDAPMDTLQWATANWDQGWPYNTTVVANNGSIGGIPTGCTATAMAIKLRYHSWPPTGNEARSYTDRGGDVQFSHAVDFSLQNYNWADMPLNNLTTAHQGVADLMYHCGVAVSMNYEVGASGAWLTTTAMHTYFRYKGTIDLRSDHEAPMMDSILAGLPVILSTGSHTLVADGYRDDPSPYFHINAGWGGGSNGWYNLDQVPGTKKIVERSYPYSSPENYQFVDGAWSGTETGTLQNPFDTVSEGYNATPVNGQLWIRSNFYSGTGNDPVVFSKAMTIYAYRGTVIIGD